MNIISTLLLFVLVLSMFATAVMLANALRRNFLKGQSVRMQVAERISQLRFGKMLEKHGVDKTAYIYTIPIIDIESEIRTCQSCTKIIECDTALQSEAMNDEALKFCPNSSTMIAHRTVC